MNVAIETFECSETAAEPIEATEEAVGIMESLGLTGQLELVKPKDGQQNVRRCPYREMTADERFVYRHFCPTVVALDKYAASPIPLRVLQIAAHAKSLGMLDHLQVWDKAKAEVKDPVLVGCTGKYDFSPDKIFILARWGEVLETFSVLLNRALKEHRENLLDQAKRMIPAIESATNEEIMRSRVASW